MTAVLGFMFAGLTIRWLGESEAGFAIALSTIIGINSTFGGLGLGSASVRLISRAYADNNSREIQQIAGVFFFTSLIFGLLGFCIFNFGAPWIIGWAKYKGNPEIASWYCTLVGGTFLIQQLTSSFNIILDSLQRYDIQTKINTTFTLANGILGITFLKASPNILTLGLLQTTLALLSLIVTSFWISRILGFLIYPSWHKGRFIELWGFGKWVYMTEITGTLMNGLDKVFLTSVFGSASLPYYTFAQRIYQTVHGVLVGQSSYLFPLMSSQENIEEATDRVEDRLRWFIALLSAFIYSGLIIAGSAILTIVVSADFAANAYFQLLVFSLVGYIQAQGIVSFFFGLSRGDSKGNWIYHMIVGISYLPFMTFLALTFGFKYAVIGQLAMLFGIIYLCHRGKNKMSWREFMTWLLKPLKSSLIIITLACLISFASNLILTNILVQLGLIPIFYGIAIMLVIYFEINYFNGHDRLDTIKKAIFLITKRGSS